MIFNEDFHIFTTLILLFFIMKRTFYFFIFLPFFALSQSPAGYYDGTQNLSGYALKTKLHEIISNKPISWYYGDLVAFYNQTDVDKYYENDGTLLDIYSENPFGIDAYEYTTENLISGASAEGQGWNREHMMPQSTFYSNYPMYSDLFYVIPADARINQLRSNYPYGVSSTSTVYYNFTNGSKIGGNATPNSPYTGRVYEPIDEFKGDIARGLLYFVVRYEGKLESFKFDSSTNPASDSTPLNGTEEKGFDDWYLQMLISWHHADPVSQREIDRNNEVYAIQKNRNPFIDHPEWVDLIWNQTPDNVAPQYPSNLQVTQTSAYFVTLSWSAPNDEDLLGYEIYQDGVLVAKTKNLAISIDHLSPSTSYTFTVRAYDNSYNKSAVSNSAYATTLNTDVYSSDLLFSKYIEGSSYNKALEIVNKTGHDVNLDSYSINIQLGSSSSYYMSSNPFQLEGILPNNSAIVVINPDANLSCYSTEEARFITGAPQTGFTGANYIEFDYNGTPIDVIGTYKISNSSTLANVSLYRLVSVNQPNNTFTLSEWEKFPINYCQDLGSLTTDELPILQQEKIILYPNPVTDLLYIKGTNISKVLSARIYNMNGQLLRTEKSPFKIKNHINVSGLRSGTYILELDNQSYKFIKK